MTPIDALGDPVVIGECYGYSTSDGGWSRTTVGVATKITESGKVRLDKCVVTRYLYGDECDYNPHSGTSSIKSHHIFPVSKDKYEKAKEETAE